MNIRTLAAAGLIAGASPQARFGGRLMPGLLTFLACAFALFMYATGKV
jgi:hypothetical protein